MKQLTNYQRTANYLVKVFKLVNEEYFNNELETPTITIQSRPGTHGHVSVSKIWHNGEFTSFELNIAAETISRPIENICSTILHEAVHLYCLQNNIKDTCNQGVYHNKTFKKIAEEKCHLSISRHEKYGWTITEPTEETLDFCIRNGLEDIQISRGVQYSYGIGVGVGTGTSAPTPRTKKPSSTRKYICPCCGNSFRATKVINVLCIDCNEQFVLA